MNSSSTCSTECWEMRMAFWVEGIILPVIAAFGIIGNILCVSVFSKKKLDLKPAFSNILKCLSVFDIVFLACIIWLYGVPEIIPSYYDTIEPHVTPWVLPVTQCALTGSVYSVVAVALERYFNTCKPFSRNMGNVCNGLGYIFTIITFSILYNLIKFFEFETVYVDITDPETSQVVSVAQMNLTVLRSDPVYATANLVINTTVVGVIPILLLTFLNSRIIQTMKRNTLVHNKLCSAERRDQAMIALLSGVVVVLIVCHTPKTVINIYESYQMVVHGSLKFEPFWSKLVIKFSHLLLGLSSAVNILIYSYKDFNFRSVLLTGCNDCTGSQNFSTFRRRGPPLSTETTRLQGEVGKNKDGEGEEKEDIV